MTNESSGYLLNVAIVFPVGLRPGKDSLLLISVETLGTGLGPICFQLKEMKGYFITVIMINRPSIWVHSFGHVCNTQVGGAIRQIMSINAHACVCGCKTTCSVYVNL